MPSDSMVSRSPSYLTWSPVRRGFTLPEMLIVIVMISLLSLVAIPRFATANGKRHMQSARMRIAAGLATARQAAIQKGETVRFRIASNRVTVSWRTDTLMSRVPLDTLYKVSVINTADIGDPFIVDFTSRGFATLGTAKTIIRLGRAGVPDDSVVVTSTGMVQR